MKTSESKTQTPNQARGESYWKKIFEDYESSNLARSDYCRKHQISYDNFGYWFRKLKKGSDNSLIPIKIKSESNHPIEKNKILSTLVLKNGNSLLIYDKEVLLIVLSERI
jgi:hypothetical protein